MSDDAKHARMFFNAAAHNAAVHQADPDTAGTLLVLQQMAEGLSHMSAKARARSSFRIAVDTAAVADAPQDLGQVLSVLEQIAAGLKAEVEEPAAVCELFAPPPETA
ncbi:MAG: hypothetical protein H6843_09835 [Rhodospirillaceae bacterium]|nr:hypothetical protein [Rhodospirillaceae bacterium]